MPPPSGAEGGAPPPAPVGEAGAGAGSTPGAERAHLALLASTFAIAVCGLVYELLAGTVSSYLLGDSVYQFSLVIGMFMAAMGFGSYLSRFVSRRVAEVFVWAQLAVGLAGGTSALVLFFAFSHLENYAPFLIGVSVTVGALVGLEVPLVIRLLRRYRALPLNVSNVLTVDYLGALLASILFPVVLVPHLGLVRTALLFGLLNTFVAGLALYTFRHALASWGRGALAAAAVAALLGTCFASADRITGRINARLYSGEIIHAERTPYQEIVITRSQEAVNLFINGALQFSSLDEYRYHEALVHPALTLARHRAQILVLGGGDGLAVREVLKHRAVEHVTVVDIDPAVTGLFRTNRLLRRLNRDALNDPRVQVINADAAKFLEAADDVFDVVIIDLPDPHDIALSRLYSRWFYGLVRAHLAADGIVVTQATSPLYAREAFWCIERTLAAAVRPGYPEDGLRTVPYHAYVPTFGDWGFVMASHRRLRLDAAVLSVTTRYLDAATLARASVFAPDMATVPTRVNTLDAHPLPAYYEAGWARWYR